MLLSGFAASFYREDLAGKNNKELIQYFTYVFSDTYPEIEITQATVNSGLDNNYTPLSITIHAKYPREKANTKVPMLWESNYLQISRVVDRRHPLESSFKILIDSTNTVADGSKFKFESTPFDNKYAQLSNQKKNSENNISSLRKRCSGTKEEFESFRKGVNQLIPTIILH